MKRFFVLLLLIVVSFAGCNFQLPKSLSVKTRANYNFTVAKLDMDLSEYFSYSKIFEGVESDAMKIYDYWPNKLGDVQKFLLSMPLGGVQIDFASYLDKLDVTEKAKDMSFSQEINVPEIKPVKVEETIQLPESLRNSPDDVIPINPPIELPEVEVKFELSTPENTFEECVISEGTITLEFISQGWSNPNIDWNVSLSGGIELSNSDWVKITPVKYEANLAGCTFKNEDSNMIIKATVSADSANVKNACKIKGSCSIEGIESIKVKIPDGIQTEINETVPLNINEAIKGITLGDSKIEFKYWNTLPEGNDLKLTCKSGFLGIAEKTEDLKGGTEKDNKKTISYIASNGEGGKVIGRDGGGNLPDFDFKAGFQFGSENGYIVARNVKPGDTYEVGVEVSVEFDWISVTVNIDSSGLGLSEKTIDTGIDMSSLTKGLKDAVGEGVNSDLLDNITFPEIPLYVYCQIPEIDVFKAASFNGTVTVGVIDNGAYVEKEDLFNGAIKAQKLPDLAIENKIVVSDISNEEKYPASAKIENLTKFLDMDSSGNSLAVQCKDVSITGADASGDITIYKSELDELKNNSNIDCSIEIQALAVVPLQFKVGKDENKDVYFLDLMSLIKGASGGGSSDNEDLFGRAEALNDETIASYIEVIKSAKINFADTKLPFKCNAYSPASALSSLGLVIDLGITGADDYKNISLDESDVKVLQFSSNGVLSVSGKEVLEMLQTYPLKSSVALAFPKGEFSILRSTRLATTVNIGLSTDGTISLDALMGGK